MRGYWPINAERSFVTDPRVRRFFDLHMTAVSAASPVLALVFRVVAIISIIVVIAVIGVGLWSQVWIDTVQSVTVRVTTSQHHRAVTGH
jgi:hypothetical protein